MNRARRRDELYESRLFFQPGRIESKQRDLRKIAVIGVTLIVCVLAAPRLNAEKPTLEHIHPVAVAPGTTNELKLSGKFEPWPPKIWSSAPGLEFAFGTNKNAVQVTVAPEAKPGPALLRAYNSDGTSEPVIFVVNNGVVLPDAEPNNEFANPQSLTNFPATVAGRLDKNSDVDSYGLRVKAGQWIDARVESHTLMSEVDAVLRLTTADGYQVAWNHDFASFDPRLVWRASHDEQLVLQVFGFKYPADAQIQLSGGSGAIYLLKLALSDEPPADLSVPMNEQSELHELPVELHGAICPAGDEDAYSLEMTKDERIEVRVVASEFGSPLDPWIALRDEKGKQLARNDDAEGSRDPVLEWKAPSGGKFSIIVGSLTHQGEEDWRYRLHISKAAPDYHSTVTASSLVMEPNSTNELKISTRRLGDFEGELVLTVRDLPEGVEAEPVKVDAKAKDATLKLVSKDAPPFNGPIKILATNPATDEEKAAQFELVSRSQNNGVPGGYSTLLVERTADIWLTVKEKPASK